MAYEIVSRLEKQGNTEVLKRLSDAVTISERKSQKLHKDIIG